MTVTITTYGGVNEIGGNKILVEDGQVRVLLDFGKAYGRYGDYFDGILTRERVGRGLLDALELGLLPPLEGLYREDLVPVLDPDPPRKRKVVRPNVGAAYERFWGRFRRHPRYRDLRATPVDAILLSHAHLDHTGDLDYIRTDVPVFSTRLTAFIAKAMQDSGKPGSGGVVYANPHLVTAECLLETDRNSGYHWRRWGFLDGAPEEEVFEDDPFAGARSFWHWRPAKQDKPAPGIALYSGGRPLGLQHFPLDHSIPGAAGFLLQTSAGPVAYTGDLRFHGKKGTQSWAFAQVLQGARPKALLCEGTRLEAQDSIDEAKVLENCLAAVRRVAGRLVVADFAPRNIERLETFLQIARESGRSLLVQPRDAYLLEAVHLADPAAFPAFHQVPHLALYNDPKGKKNKWEKAIRGRWPAVGPEEVHQGLGDYILAFSLWDIADLLDIAHLLGRAPGGVYIYSNSQAYDEEQMVDLVRLWNWIGHLEMEPVGLQATGREAAGRVCQVGVVPGYHASGHADGSALLRFVRTAQPEVLIPIHTEEANWWVSQLAGSGIRVEVPQVGQPIPL